jgi:hypothetical protein
MSLLVPLDPDALFIPFSWLDASFALRTFGALDYRIYRDDIRFLLTPKTEDEKKNGVTTWIDQPDLNARGGPLFRGRIDMGIFDPCWTDPGRISTSYKGQEVVYAQDWLRPTLAALDPSYAYSIYDKQGLQLGEATRAFAHLQHVAPRWLRFEAPAKTQPAC